jgi:uncharacterized membrane protein SirB2
MALYYNEIKWVHIGCVLLSGSLFFLRGLLMLNGSLLASDRRLSRLSYGIDTALLVAAVLLTVIIHQYPLVQGWLTVKVLLLIVYIVLGVFALRRGKTQRSRMAFFVAALLVYGFIISVAVTHNPRGALALPQFASYTRISALCSPCPCATAKSFPHSGTNRPVWVWGGVG